MHIGDLHLFPQKNPSFIVISYFTIKCTKLQELRNKFYQKISDILPSFYNLSDTEKFHLIFRSNDYDVSKCCIKGISEMYKFRCSLI